MLLSSIKILMVCPSGRAKFVIFTGLKEILQAAGGGIRIRHYFDERVVVMTGKNGIKLVCQYHGFTFTSLSYAYLEKFYWSVKKNQHN